MPSKTPKRQTPSRRSAKPFQPLTDLSKSAKNVGNSLYATLGSFQKSARRFTQTNPMLAKLSSKTRSKRKAAADKAILKRNSGGTRKKRKTSKRKIKSGCN